MKQNNYLPSDETQIIQSRKSTTIYNSIWSLVLLLIIFTVGCSKSAVTGDSATTPNTNSLSGSVNLMNADVTQPLGPGPINLMTAGDFTLLSKAGITTTGTTSILGDIGTSPIAATAMTGFGLIMATDNQSSHTPIVTGKVYAANYATPSPAKMTSAISDMQTAFTTANGLVINPIVNLYAGDISGRTLLPGLYKYSTGVLITNVGVTLSGGPNDTWVFQIAQNLTVRNSAIITLQGGAQVKNIFWVVSGQANLGTYCNFKGNILSKTLISCNTGATITGKLLAQTAVTLIANTITPN
jgi:hypothetical protein